MATLLEAREVWKYLSDQDFDNLLWSCTPYPYRSESEVADYLIKIHPKFDGDVKETIKVHSDEFDVAWQEHKEREEQRQASLGTESNNG